MTIPLSLLVSMPAWWVGTASAGQWVEGRVATPAALEIVADGVDAAGRARLLGLAPQGAGVCGARGCATGFAVVTSVRDGDAWTEVGREEVVGEAVTLASLDLDRDGVAHGVVVVLGPGAIKVISPSDAEPPVVVSRYGMDGTCVALGAVDGDGDGWRSPVLRCGAGVFVPARGVGRVPEFASAIEGTSSVAVGDVDGDGREDLAELAEGAGPVRVHRGWTTGVLGATAWELPRPEGRATVASGDVDGDGLTDLLVATWSAVGGGQVQLDVWRGGANAWRAAPSASFVVPSAGARTPQVLAIDVDGDGLVDPVVAAGREVWIAASGGGVLRELAVTPARSSTVELDVMRGLWVDLEADGRWELLDRTTAEQDPETWAVYGWAEVGDDLDRDGVGWPIDCADHASTVAPGAWEGPGFTGDRDCDGVATCGVDLDGDLVVGTEFEARAGFPGGSCGVVMPGVDCDDRDRDRAPGRFEGIADGVDSDCDGLDLCWVDADDDGLAEGPIAQNTCSGEVFEPNPEGSRFAPRGLGDVDGDGYADVARVRREADGVWLDVLHGAAGGLALAPAVSVEVQGAAVQIVGPVDVDGDGWRDLVYAVGSPVDGALEVSVHRGGPVGVASAPDQRVRPGGEVSVCEAAPNGVGPHLAPLRQVGDVDGDGADEIGWVCADGDRLTTRLLWGSEDGLVEGDLLGWTDMIGVGDADGDGRADVVERGLREAMPGVPSDGAWLHTAGVDGAGAPLPCVGTIPLSLFELRMTWVGDTDGDGAEESWYAVSASPRAGDRGAGCAARGWIGRDGEAAGVRTTYTSLGDLDGDGRSDVEVLGAVDLRLPGGRTRPAIVELSGSGAYGLRSSFASFFGDVDGDGIADPLAGQASRVGDVDGDGRDDLAMEAADGSIVTLGGEALIADCDGADAAAPAAHRGAWICEGQPACAVDADGDGWAPGVREGGVEVCASVRLPDGLRLGDCDDAAAAVFPGALDPIDGVDADCDGAEGLRVELPDVLGAGGTIRVRTAGGVAGVRTAVLVSTAGPGDGPCPPALGGACVGLLRPSVLSTEVSGPAGATDSARPLPAGLTPGQMVWVQAVDAQGGRSPVVAATIWRH